MDESAFESHWLAYDWSEISEIDFPQVCDRIAERTLKVMDFWKTSNWAPPGPAQKLDKAMLDWQASLAKCLTKWLDDDSPGELILAWTNLGALVEGFLTLFLTVHYNTYTRQFDQNDPKQKDPEELTMRELLQFFRKNIWDVGFDWSDWVRHVQERRNSIHAFRPRELGTFEEWRRDVRIFLLFFNDTDGRLPYPDLRYFD